MTEETETREEEADGNVSENDKRFEVKWRKKADTPSSTIPEVTPGATGESKDVASLQQDLKSERERVRDLQDKWQRAAADLANLRRRTEQEKGDVEKFASMLLVQQLLPVLDNFDRALATIPGNLQLLTWIQGVMLIERHLRAILEQQGLQPIEAQGQPFNAHYHEAIDERETDEARAETVLQEYQKGYTMHGQVIRPSLVQVAKAPRQVSPPGAEEPPSTVQTAEDQPSVNVSPGQNAETAQDPSEVEGEEIAEEAETENTGP